MIGQKQTAYQNLKQYYCKKGKKSKLEVFLRSFLYSFSKKERKNFKIIKPLFEDYLLRSTCFVRLLTRIRKRKKYVIYRLQVFTRKQNYSKKAISLLIKSVKNQGSLTFLDRIDKLINMLQKTHNALDLKQKHQLIAKLIPYKWRKQLRQLQQRIKRSKSRKDKKNRVRMLNLSPEKKSSIAQ